MKRVLIVHTWGLGDFIHFSPVIASLRKAHPGVAIDIFIGTPRTEPLIRLYRLNILASINVRRFSFRLLMRLLLLGRRRYDALIFTAGIHSKKADLLAFFVRASKKVALITEPHTPRFLTDYSEFNPEQHMVTNNLRLLKLLGIEDSKEIPFIPNLNNVRAVEGSVLIHPGCDKQYPYKRWPIERFARVADELIAAGCKVSAVFGPDESVLCDDFLSHIKSEKIVILRNPQITKLINIISSHKVLLNNDSGLGHIAAALNRDVVSILGPSDPVRCSPYSSQATILYPEEILECMPCMTRTGRRGCAEIPCLRQIEWQTVLQSVLGRLGQKTADLMRAQS